MRRREPGLKADLTCLLDLTTQPLITIQSTTLTGIPSNYCTIVLAVHPPLLHSGGPGGHHQNDGYVPSLGATTTNRGSDTKQSMKIDCRAR